MEKMFLVLTTLEVPVAYKGSFDINQLKTHLFEKIRLFNNSSYQISTFCQYNDSWATFCE